MPRSVRTVALLLAVLVAGAALVEARGGGRMGGAGAGSGGGAKRSKRSTRASAEVERLTQEAYRRDALLRLRHVDW